MAEKFKNERLARDAEMQRQKEEDRKQAELKASAVKKYHEQHEKKKSRDEEARLNAARLAYEAKAKAEEEEWQRIQTEMENIAALQEKAQKELQVVRAYILTNT